MHAVKHPEEQQAVDDKRDSRTCTTVEMPQVALRECDAVDSPEVQRAALRGALDWGVRLAQQAVPPVTNPGAEPVPALDTLRQVAREKGCVQVERLVSEVTRSVALREAAYESRIQHVMSMYRRVDALQEARIASLVAELAAVRAMADKLAMKSAGGGA